MATADYGDPITFRLTDESREELEDIVWDNRVRRSEVLRELTTKFLEDEELQADIFDRLEQHQVEGSAASTDAQDENNDASDTRRDDEQEDDA